jgi:hypothetical protein
MDHEPLSDDRTAPELIEAGPEHGSGPSPVLYRPEPRFRSLLAESRPVEPVGRDPSVDAFTLPLPSVGSVVRSAGWAALVAIPLLLLLGWQVALVSGALAVVTRELDRRFGRANISFAAGFLPFRDGLGWPHGVQEEDGVQWNWSPRPRNGHASRL